jgi:hypothetical protein
VAVFVPSTWPDIHDPAGTADGVFLDNGGAVWNVRHSAYGLVADGVTDNSAALSRLLTAVYAAGGGVIYFPPSASPYLFLSPIVLPNSAPFDGTHYLDPGRQPTVIFRGGGAWASNTVGGVALDLQYQGGLGKVQTYGRGTLRFENLALQTSLNDTGETTPFLLTTNTVLHLDTVFFRGTTAAGVSPPAVQTGVFPTNDCVVFGGTNLRTADNSPTSQFTGYGSTMTRCRATSVKRLALFNNAANQVIIRGCFVEGGGNPDAFGGVLDFADATGSSGTNSVWVEDVGFEATNYQTGAHVRANCEGCGFHNLSPADTFKVTLLSAVPPPRTIVAANSAGDAHVTSEVYYPPGTVLRVDTGAAAELVTVGATTPAAAAAAGSGGYFAVAATATQGAYAVKTSQTGTGAAIFGSQPVYITDGANAEWNVTVTYADNGDGTLTVTLARPLRYAWTTAATVYGSNFRLPITGTLANSHAQFAALAVQSILSPEWLPTNHSGLLPDYRFALGSADVNDGADRVEAVQFQAWSPSVATVLSAAVTNPGATSVTLAADPDPGGIQPCIVIDADDGTGSTYGTKQEVRHVASVSGTGPYTVTLDQALALTHPLGAAVHAGPFTLTTTAALQYEHPTNSGNLCGTVAPVRFESGAAGNRADYACNMETPLAVSDGGGGNSALASEGGHLSTFAARVVANAGVTASGKVPFGLPGNVTPPAGLSGSTVRVPMTGADVGGVFFEINGDNQGPVAGAVDTNTGRVLWQLDSRGLVMDPSSRPGVGAPAPTSTTRAALHLGQYWGGPSSSTRNWAGTPNGTWLGVGFSRSGPNAFAGDVARVMAENADVYRFDSLGNVAAAGNVAAGGGKALQVGPNSITFGAAAPAAGTWAAGDVVWNSAPSAGQPDAWRCTAGGTPGTWAAAAGSGGTLPNSYTPPLISVACDSTVGHTFDLGQWADNGTVNGATLRFTATAYAGGISIGKTYVVPCPYDGTGGIWKILPPTSANAYLGTDLFDVDVRLSAGLISLRARVTQSYSAFTLALSMCVDAPNGVSLAGTWSGPNPGNNSSDSAPAAYYAGCKPTFTALTVAGGSTVTSVAALATTATDGFLYVPTCAGAPTGTPTPHAGTAPLVYDSANNYLYIYNGGWKKTPAPFA